MNFNNQQMYQGQGQAQGGAFYAPNAMGGYQYAPLPQAKMTQGLSIEEIKELRRKGTGFSLDIPAIEFTRAKCTHKENGSFSLIDNHDGTHTCSICGENIKLADYDVETAKQVTQNFLDLFQSTKLYYLNIPESYIDNITQMIPVLKQMPELYRIALADFQRYENGNANGLTNRGGMFGANLLNTIVNPMSGAYGQPMGNQPMYGGQPQYTAPQGQYYPQPQNGMYNSGDPNYGVQYNQVPGQYPNTGVQYPQGNVASNGFGYYGGDQGQSNPVVNTGNQYQANQSVAGGAGASFTKENAQKQGDVNTTKIYNA
jgi:hypothetical protein